MDMIQDWIRLSQYAGYRADLVQAGGGNTSFKPNAHEMCIKSSGVLLAEVTRTFGHVSVDYEYSKKFLNEENCSEGEGLKVLSEGVPSIETYLHAVLGTFVLHTHPWAVTAVVCRKDWKAVLTTLFPEPIIMIDYFTPGVPLGREVARKVNEYQKQVGQLPQLIFLKNHGVIVAGENVDEIIAKHEAVVSALAAYTKLDTAHYHFATQLMTFYSKISRQDAVIIPVTHQQTLEKLSSDPLLWQAPVLFPDSVVFCGFEIVRLSDLDDPRPLQHYYQRFRQWPKVFRYRNHFFVVAKTLKKAKESEDVFCAHILTAGVNSAENWAALPQQEIDFLAHWEAEKLRMDA